MSVRRIRYFLFLFVIVVGEDNAEKSVLPEPYIPILENIPMFFEYLLETLEERPEVLENHEVNVFKRETDTQGKRDIVESDLDQDNKYCYAYEDVITTNIDDDTYTTVLHEYGHSNKEINKRDLQKYQVESNNREDIDFDGVTNDVDEVDVDDFDKIGEYENYIDKFGDTYQGSIAMRKLMLSPEEVAQKALELEKMLEDYDAQNKR